MLKYIYLSYTLLCEVVNARCAICRKIVHNYWIQNSHERKKFRLAFYILPVFDISTTNRRKELKIDCFNLLRCPRLREIEERS